MRTALSCTILGSILLLIACSQQATESTSPPDDQVRPSFIWDGSDPCKWNLNPASFVFRICHPFRAYNWNPGWGIDCGFRCTTTYPFSYGGNWASGVSYLQNHTSFTCRAMGNRLAFLASENLVSKWIPSDIHPVTGLPRWGSTFLVNGETISLHLWDNLFWQPASFFHFVIAHEAYHSIFPYFSEDDATNAANSCFGTSYPSPDYEMPQ